MNVVYIVVYRNFFEEEWGIRGVFEDAEKADDYAKDLNEKHGNWHRKYDVEEWHMADV